MIKEKINHLIKFLKSVTHKNNDKVHVILGQIICNI